MLLSYGGNLPLYRYDSVPQCKQGNQQCGRRCIPPDQECQSGSSRAAATYKKLSRTANTKAGIASGAVLSVGTSAVLARGMIKDKMAAEALSKDEKKRGEKFNRQNKEEGDKFRQEMAKK